MALLYSKRLIHKSEAYDVHVLEFQSA